MKNNSGMRFLSVVTPVIALAMILTANSCFADGQKAQAQKTTIQNISANAVKSDQAKFEDLLKEAGLSFKHPEGFIDIKVEPDYVLPYEKRLHNTDKSMEVRYAIRPLNRIVIDYDDPHNSAPHPNDLFDMLFRTLSETLAGGTYVLSHAYSADQARKLFNAGWASVGVFDISPDIDKTYKQAMLLTIHHNDKADAYMLFLTNDLDKQRDSIKRLQSSLKFTLFEKGINQPDLAQ